MPEYRHGALYVVEEARSKDPVQRELKKLDDRLFLERQRTFRGEDVWCVVCQVSGDHPPLTILEHRDSDLNPLPLTMSIVDRVARMERDGSKLTASVMKKNAERIEYGRRKADEAYAEMARDMIPRINGERRPVLPRGIYLNRSRNKRRNLGQKI